MVRPLVGLVILFLTVLANAKENVRKELSRLQEQTGLTLAWYLSRIQTVQFNNRSAATDQKSATSNDIGNGLLSPDGLEIALPSSGPEYRDRPRHLTILRRDGTIESEYPEITEATAVCWSHDKSTLVVHVAEMEKRPVQYHLLILELRSKKTRIFGDAHSYATSQCWSPDDKFIVYSAGEEVRVYDLQDATSRLLAQGTGPTWSPDGKWIAFSDRKAFRSISPSGGENKVLFKDKQARSELWWSPDSRFVAYLGEGGTFLETLKYLDVGLIQIRVRRLSDGSEDWVYQTPDVPPVWSLNCEWLNSKIKESK